MPQEAGPLVFLPNMGMQDPLAHDTPWGPASEAMVRLRYNICLRVLSSHISRAIS